jgi:hypothetical protein
MMILIKVNEVPNSKEGLKERTRRAWRINQDRLYNQDILIAVYKGEILEEYKVLGYGADQVEPKRVAFDLEEVPNSQLKGKTIDYRTANPCTIVDPADLGLVQIPQPAVAGKQYKFIEPDTTRQEIGRTLIKALERDLTEQEFRTIYWLGDCDFETRGVITDLFKEMLERINYFKED